MAAMGEFRKSALELGRRLLGGIGAALVTVALVWDGLGVTYDVNGRPTSE